MKRVAFFIGSPLLILIFAILNCLLLYTPIMEGSYQGSVNESDFEVVISNNIYIVNNTSNEVLDYGTYTHEGGFFSLETHSTNTEIQIDCPFVLKYQNFKLYNGKAIFLQILYGVMILAGITSLAFSLIKTTSFMNNSESRKQKRIAQLQAELDELKKDD